MPSENEILQRAKEFVSSRQYDDARNLLLKIPNNPTAAKWLAKLDEIAPTRTVKPPQKNKTLNRNLFVWVFASLLLIGVAAISFFVGRSTGIDKGKAEGREIGQTEVVATLQAFFNPDSDSGPTETDMPTRTPEPTETPTPTPDPYRLGTLLNPMPVGDLIEYEAGTLKVLAYHKPTAFLVYELENFSLSSEPAEAIEGADFISIELEFTCSATRVTCENVPESDLALILADGRIIDENRYVPIGNIKYLGEDDLVGGSSTQGWIVFQMPSTAIIQALRVTPSNFDGEAVVFAALPSPTDGYSLEQPWITDSDGFQTKNLPSLSRDLTNAGLLVYRAQLLRGTNNVTALTIITATDEILFFENTDVIPEVEPVIRSMIDHWSSYHEDADRLLISLVYNSFNDLEAKATVLIFEEDIVAYAQNRTSWNAFKDTWVIQLEN